MSLPSPQGHINKITLSIPAGIPNCLLIVQYEDCVKLVKDCYLPLKSQLGILGGFRGIAITQPLLSEAYKKSECDSTVQQPCNISYILGGTDL